MGEPKAAENAHRRRPRLLSGHLGVDRRRHHRVLVVQTLRDDMQRNAGLRQPRRMRVTQAVRCQIGDASSRAYLLRLGVNGSGRVQAAAVPVREQQPGVMPRARRGRSFEIASRFTFLSAHARRRCGLRINVW